MFNLVWYFVFDLYNKWCFVDSSKYGQRILEKMGWKPGKGLGVNEQGIVNALRVKYKSDLRGNYKIYFHITFSDSEISWIKSNFP